MATFTELPIELRHEVLKYSHQPKEESLLKDIEDFNSSFNKVFELYKQYEREVHNYNENIVEFEALCWLTNNIDVFIQEKVGMRGHLYGTSKEFIKYLENRSIIFKNKGITLICRWWQVYSSTLSYTFYTSNIGSYRRKIHGWYGKLKKTLSS